MKVLYLYEGLPAYRKDFFNLLNMKLKEEGHTLKLLYGKKDKNESLQQEGGLDFEIESFPIKHYFNRNSFRLTSFKGMYDAFKREAPDVYVLQFHVATLTYWRIFRYARKENIPYITWDCNYQKEAVKGLVKKVRTFLVDRTFSNAYVCLTYGTKFKNYLCQKGEPINKIVVAQNTINVEKILLERDNKCINRDFNHPIHLLYVGVINNRKNLDTAIIAVSNLINQGEDLYFDIVGGGDSYDESVDLVKKLGMEKRIVLYGPKHGKEVKSFFENADVFLLPGSGGLAINEALAYSLPIISSEGDGTIIDLIDGNGFLINNVGDVEELENAIKKFSLLSPDKMKKMAKRSEEIICERATLENMVNKHIEAIRKVINRQLC